MCSNSVRFFPKYFFPIFLFLIGFGLFQTQTCWIVVFWVMTSCCLVETCLHLQGNGFYPDKGDRFLRKFCSYISFVFFFEDPVNMISSNFIDNYFTCLNCQDVYLFVLALETCTRNQILFKIKS